MAAPHWGCRLMKGKGSCNMQLERHMGLEPTTSPWKGEMLPLHQWRDKYYALHVISYFVGIFGHILPRIIHMPQGSLLAQYSGSGAGISVYGRLRD